MQTNYSKNTFEKLEIKIRYLKKILVNHQQNYLNNSTQIF